MSNGGGGGAFVLDRFLYIKKIYLYSLLMFYIHLRYNFLDLFQESFWNTQSLTFDLQWKSYKFHWIEFDVSLNWNLQNFIEVQNWKQLLRPVFLKNISTENVYSPFFIE